MPITLVILLMELNLWLKLESYLKCKSALIGLH